MSTVTLVSKVIRDKLSIYIVIEEENKNQIVWFIHIHSIFDVGDQSSGQKMMMILPSGFSCSNINLRASFTRSSFCPAILPLLAIQSKDEIDNYNVINIQFLINKSIESLSRIKVFCTFYRLQRSNQWELWFVYRLARKPGREWFPNITTLWLL